MSAHGARWDNGASVLALSTAKHVAATHGKEMHPVVAVHVEYNDTPKCFMPYTVYTPIIFFHL